MFRLIDGVGVGLAANQIGIDSRLAVIEIPPNSKNKKSKPVPPTVLINPRILKYSKDKVGGWEGCLSCSGVRFWIERPKDIEVSYVGKDREHVRKIVKGWEARVFQHEIDHLNGIVCGERVACRNGQVVKGAVVSEAWYQKHVSKKSK